MSNIQCILCLFILLVIILSTGVFFKDFLIEGFHSSSSNSKGKGIGDSYAAPLDLGLNTDNITFSNKMYSVNENGSDDVPTFFGLPGKNVN